MLKFNQDTVLTNKRGFTLVELMIAMAVISVLSVLIIAAIQTARRTAGYTQAKSEMREIKTVMETFILKYGQLPPRKGPYSGSGDCCSNCSDPPSASWLNAVNDMRDGGLITQAGADQWYTDPWGSYYAYDDNFGQANVTVSYFCTAGPDKRKGSNGSTNWGTGDDFCWHITHEGVTLW